MDGIEGLLARDFGVLPQVKARPMAGDSSRPSPDPPSRGPIPADPPRPHPTTTSSVTPPPCPPSTRSSSHSRGLHQRRRLPMGLGAVPRAEEKRGVLEEAPSHCWTTTPANPARRRGRTTRCGSRRSGGRPANTDLVAVRRAQTTTKAATRRRSGHGCWQPTTRSQSRQ